MKRVLIIGCGNLGGLIAPIIAATCPTFVLTRSTSRIGELREMGVVPIVGNLDNPNTISRLGGLATHVIHTVPPASKGSVDKRTKNLINALTLPRSLPQRLVYISTTGVYGDCGGDIVQETRLPLPRNPRAIRRLDAETQLRAWGGKHEIIVTILRVVGIYGKEASLFNRNYDPPVLEKQDDPYSNHIHLSDLARAVIFSANKGRPGRLYNISDDTPLRMSEYFEAVAKVTKRKLPKPISLAKARLKYSDTMMSFLMESKRVANFRMKKELKLVLNYPKVDDGLVNLIRS